MTRTATIAEQPKEPVHWLPPVLVVLAVLAATSGPTLAKLTAVYRTDPTMGHGWYVPAVAAALLWKRRRLVSARTYVPCWSAAWFVLAGTAAALAGLWLHNITLEALGLTTTAAGAIVLLAGRTGWKAAWPAALFLVFMVPLPPSLSVALCGPLQRLATSGSVYLLQTLGFPAVADGGLIILGDLRLEVARACAGLGLCAGFLALSTAAAMWVDRPVWERAIVALSGAPLAIFVNAFRIALTAAASTALGPGVGRLLLHDVAGLISVALGVCLLGLEFWLLSRLLIVPPDRIAIPVRPQGRRFSRRGSDIPGPTPTRGVQTLSTNLESEVAIRV